MKSKASNAWECVHMSATTATTDEPGSKQNPNPQEKILKLCEGHITDLRFTYFNLNLYSFVTKIFSLKLL